MKKTRRMEKNEEQMTSKIAITEKEIRDLCSAELPFSLIPDQFDEIKNQIESDKKTIQLNYEREIFEQNMVKISSILSSESFLPGISGNAKESINTELIKF